MKLFPPLINNLLLPFDYFFNPIHTSLISSGFLRADISAEIRLEVQYITDPKERNKIEEFESETDLLLQE